MKYILFVLVCILPLYFPGTLSADVSSTPSPEVLIWEAVHKDLPGKLYLAGTLQWVASRSWKRQGMDPLLESLKGMQLC